MSQKGYLLLFDISGYTAFLSQAELEQAQGILESLLRTLLEHMEPPLIVCELEGDAIFAYVPEGSILQGQTLLETIERLYCVFSATREQMERNAACDCSGCTLFPLLDLKVVAHYGSFGLQRIVERQLPKPIGREVILAHRLLKNQIPQATGIKAYAFLTEACVKALHLDWIEEYAHKHRENYEHLGVVQGYAYDLQPVWERQRQKLLLAVAPEETWFQVEALIAAPPSLVWDYINAPQYRRMWRYADRVNVLGKGRLGEGTVQECFHGERIIVERVVDWRPFERVTLECVWPLKAVVYVTTELIAQPEGTRLVSRLSKPVGANAFHSWFVGSAFKLISRRIMAKCSLDLARLTTLIEANHPGKSLPSEPRLTEEGSSLEKGKAVLASTLRKGDHSERA